MSRGERQRQRQRKLKFVASIDFQQKIDENKKSWKSYRKTWNVTWYGIQFIDKFSCCCFSSLSPSFSYLIDATKKGWQKISIPKTLHNTHQYHMYACVCVRMCRKFLLTAKKSIQFFLADQLLVQSKEWALNYTKNQETKRK